MTKEKIVGDQICTFSEKYATSYLYSIAYSKCSRTFLDYISWMQSYGFRLQFNVESYVTYELV